MDAREVRRLIHTFQKHGLGRMVEVVSLSLEVPGQGEVDILERAFMATGSQLSFENFERFVDNCPDQAGLFLRIADRVKVAQDVVNSPGVDSRQVDAVVASLVTSAVSLIGPVLETYQERLDTAHAACVDLLDVPPMRKNSSRSAPRDDDLCVCCLDSPRSLVYRPCDHRVCCEECAMALWAKSRTCPWCRADVHDPGC